MTSFTEAASQETSSRTVSVVLCTFNGSPFLRDQLRSIEDQTLPHVEVIISDDGSTDDSLDIVEDFVRRSKRKVVVQRNLERLGYVENFLRAAALAQGAFIAFSDQDDIWHPRKLESQLQTIEFTGAAVVTHATRSFSGDIPEGWLSSAPGGATVLTDATADPWGNFRGFTLMFRRSVFDVFDTGDRGLDPHENANLLSHDRWVYFLGCSLGGIAVMPQVLALYRQHAGQLYGREAPRTVWRRLGDKRRSGATQAAALAKISHQRSDLLAQVKGASASSIALWRKRGRSYERSARLLAAPRILRPVLLVHNAAGGVYGAVADGGLGGRRLPEDALMAVLAPRTRNFAVREERA